MIRTLCVAIILSLFSAGSAAAEPVSAVEDLSSYLGESVRIEMRAGSSFQGRVSMVSGERLEILSPEGQYLILHIPGIDNIRIIEDGEDDRLFYQDSVSNRLLFVPTAFPMARGDFHVAAQELVVITSSYGISDRASLWGGISPFAGMLSGRYSLPLGESFAMSAGGLLVFDWTSDILGDLSPGLMPYVLASSGGEENNFTLGTGVMFGFPDRSLAPQGVAVTAGGKLVLTSTLAIISENWFFLSDNDGGWNSGVVLPGLAFRVAGNRFSWDIGALVMITFDETGPDLLEFPIPWLSLSYRVR